MTILHKQLYLILMITWLRNTWCFLKGRWRSLLGTVTAIVVMMLLFLEPEIRCYFGLISEVCQNEIEPQKEPELVKQQENIDIIQTVKFQQLEEEIQKFKINRQKQEEIAHQKQLADEAKRQLGIERQKKLELELERQRRLAEEAKRQLEIERQKKLELELERQKQLAKEAKRQIERQKKLELELERQRQLAEKKRQLKIERQKKIDLERQRQIAEQEAKRQEEDKKTEKRISSKKKNIKHWQGYINVQKNILIAYIKDSAKMIFQMVMEL
ncbi:hypothetical protein BGP_2573 [Beggiatoa sp. PS]|nr:hypothetical protein BGP_2573 [Beggiatoa sp. PS]